MQAHRQHSAGPGQGGGERGCNRRGRGEVRREVQRRGFQVKARGRGGRPQEAELDDARTARMVKGWVCLFVQRVGAGTDRVQDAPTACPMAQG